MGLSNIFFYFKRIYYTAAMRVTEKSAGAHLLSF
jgi:hypothetical protein